MPRHTTLLNNAMARMSKILFVLAAFCAWGVITPLSASAQSRESAYIVSGLEVDARAATAAEAQQTAWAEARLRAAQVIVERMTLAEDRASSGLPMVTPDIANRLAAAIDVQEERRSADRYIGVLRVVFDPGQVRRFFRDAQTPFTDIVAPLALLSANTSGVSGGDINLWRASLETAGAEGLTPFVVAERVYTVEQGWAVASAEGQTKGARRLVTATLSGAPSAYQVTLVETQIGGGVSGTRQLGPYLTVEDAAQGVRAAMEGAWKRASIIRSQATRPLTATAVFNSQADWVRLRSALIQAARVSELRVDVISIDGALVTFSFAGERPDLDADLRRQGVLISDGPAGPVLRLSGLR